MWQQEMNPWVGLIVVLSFVILEFYFVWPLQLDGMVYVLWIWSWDRTYRVARKISALNHGTFYWPEEIIIAHKKSILGA